MAGERVVAVVVSYNREQLLEETLSGLLAQERPVDAVIVVDNASSDGSVEVAGRFLPESDIVVLTRNTGGAGGFAVGMAEALRRAADWIWVMDDDTVPRPGALAALLDALHRHPRPSRVAALGSRVVWTDGREHPMNTPRQKPFLKREERAAATAARAMPVRSISFVSSMFRAEAVREEGLPVVDYFLWNDDFEFSARILRHRWGLAVPESVVEHKTRVLGSTDADPGPRFFFEVRNKIWLFLRSPALSPWERAVYVCASAVRWIRTIARSADRSVLWRGLSKGAVEGVRAGPRSNLDVLVDSGLDSAALAFIAALAGPRRLG
jgi:rhamnopyranosyl-N-acetylglucosaminyl-diphospho-decaprenol beta-1,3/1,4-galactofuranosyltransferase